MEKSPRVASKAYHESPNRFAARSRHQARRHPRPRHACAAGAGTDPRRRGEDQSLARILANIPRQAGAPAMMDALLFVLVVGAVVLALGVDLAAALAWLGGKMRRTRVRR